MSVQSQINRISGAVSDALAALAEKGVTVPAGTKVDGLASLIAAIEAGGGGGDVSVATGSFTLAFTGNGVVNIEHGLGKKYKCLLLYADSTAGMSTTKYECLTLVQFPFDTQSASKDTFEQCPTYYGYVFNSYTTATTLSKSVNSQQNASMRYKYSSLSYYDKNGTFGGAGYDEAYVGNTHFALACYNNYLELGTHFKTGRTYKWVVIG